MIAPRAGRVVYAGNFRSYGRIVILDHGGGWTTLITNFEDIVVPVGRTIPMGAPASAGRRADPPGSRWSFAGTAGRFQSRLFSWADPSRTGGRGEAERPRDSRHSSLVPFRDAKKAVKALQSPLRAGQSWPGNLLRSLALVSGVALIPAATSSFAAVDVDTYRELDAFMSVFERVRSEYVETVDDKTLLRGAIDGMLNSLDPHSSYLDEKGFKALMTTTEGNYGGLGLNVTQEDGAVKVIAATEGTPADRAGIKAGDYLTHIDGKLVYGGTLDEAVDQMRGPPGTTVKITVVRPGRDKPFDVSITRAIIELPAVKWEIKDRVGVINVNTFNKVTTEATLAAMNSIEKSLGGKPLGYILDLRSNPGGCSTRRSACPTPSSSAARSSRSAAARRATSSATTQSPAMPRTACQ